MSVQTEVTIPFFHEMFCILCSRMSRPVRQWINTLKHLLNSLQESTTSSDSVIIAQNMGGHTGRPLCDGCPVLPTCLSQWTVNDYIYRSVA